jgi:ligand-binding sensor domain-containing protein
MKTIQKIACSILLLAGNMTSQSQTFTNLTSANGLPSDNVNGVAVDGNNLKWFGTQEGVSRYNDTTFTNFKKADGLIDNYINCIATDVNNNVWVGTDIGISKFDGTHWTSYTKTDGLIDNTVNFIAGDTDGSVWIATGSGTSHFNGTTWKNYTTADGLPSDYISYIAVDGSGNKWFGTYLGGLSKFNGSTFTNFTIADSLPDNNIISIAMGKDNTKWIGTYFGVAVFDSQDKWTATYRKKDGLFNDFVMDIGMDSKGTMWFGQFDPYTQDGGLTRKTNTVWKVFTTADGLINAPVKRLAVDKKDKIWIATGAGVSKFTDSNAGFGDFATFPVKIYPNPASSEIHVDGLHEPGTISVRTISGSEILSESLSKGSNTVLLQNVKAGIYLLRYTTATGVYTGKLIVR